jgi:hypothetical protein
MGSLVLQIQSIYCTLTLGPTALEYGTINELEGQTEPLV